MQCISLNRWRSQYFQYDRRYFRSGCQFFEHVKNEGGGFVTIPPGVYFIEVKASDEAPIPSHTQIADNTFLGSALAFQFNNSVIDIDWTAFLKWK